MNVSSHYGLKITAHAGKGALDRPGIMDSDDVEAVLLIDPEDDRSALGISKRAYGLPEGGRQPPWDFFTSQVE